MKPKKLRKKIEQLEKRLQQGSEKLAALKRKLQQAETAKALKAARKSAVRATADRPKKKLNLSPERRAQLSAAMKARWAAKRAAQSNGTTSSNENSPGPRPQAPESRSDGEPL